VARAHKERAAPDPKQFNQERNKPMKKYNARPLFGAAAMSAVALLAAACGSGGGTGSAQSGSGPAKPIEWSSSCDKTCQSDLTLKGDPDKVECKVGISQNSLKHPYGVAQKAALEKAAKTSFPKMKVITTDGQGDAVTQSSQVQDLVTQNIDVLVITALDAKSLAPAVKAAVDAGVKVINHDRNVATPVTTYIGANSVEAGETAAKFMVDKLGSKGGNVVEIQGTLGASATIDRNKGMENVFKDHPNVKVIATQAADYQRGDAFTAMQDTLQRFKSGNIDAVFAQNDEMALGAIQAIKDAGREKEMFVTGFDGAENAFEAIKAGTEAATVVYPLNAPEAIAAAAKACLGEPLPKSVKLTGPLVTPDNVADFLGKGF
jgi:ribose transport system substrate-binding protein